MKMNALRALRHRNFRLFFCGQSVSLVGTWMTRLATSWLVYRLTGSSLLLGVISFAGQIPTFLLGPVAGVWADRWERRRVLLVTQVLAALQSLMLAGLTLSGRITIQEIVWLSVFQGLINAFDMPARQSFLVQMVNGRTDLSNAIALNSTMVNGARLFGPALAGIIIAAVGEGYCFLIDGLSYFAVLASLLAMKIESQEISKSAGSLLVQLKEGWTYVSSFAPIRTVLVSFAMVSFMGVPYSVLMPVFATKILHGGPHTLGFLMGGAGVGSIISALSLAARRSVRGL
jgi:MFS family permease